MLYYFHVYSKVIQLYIFLYKNTYIYMYICIYIYIYIYSFFRFFPLLVITINTDYNYLCYSVDPCCLSKEHTKLCSTPGFLVFHHLLEFAKTYVH